MHARAAAASFLTDELSVAPLSLCARADYIVKPLYQALGLLVPELGARCLPLIECNRAAWSAVIDLAPEPRMGD
jgi:hypothetical protein